MNRVCKVLKIEKPVVQGAMAFTSLTKLVSTVSNAGGLGTLGIAFLPQDKMKEQILATKELTDKPFAVNVMMNPGLVERADQVLMDTRPAVVYADGFNWPEENAAKYFPKWEAAGMTVIVKASDVRDAEVAVKYGAKLVIAKGWEGGGHVAYEATSVLVPAICDAVDVPVVAAGGISDGRGFASAFALGAEGVELGTAFLVSDELEISSAAKQAIIDSKDMGTAIISNANDAPFRMLANDLSKENLDMEATTLKKDAAIKEKGLDAKSVIDGMYKGDTKNGAIMVGQIAQQIHQTTSVNKIIDDLLEDGYKNLKALSKIEK